MDQHNEKNIEPQSSSDNIFDDFTQAQEIQKEVEKFEEKESRDLFFYFKKLNAVLFSINIAGFIVVSLFYVYAYIQNSDVNREYPFLKPICGIFLGDVPINSHSCYGVSAILTEYEGKVDTEKKLQAEKILPILGESYSIENFNLSRKVRFLLDKSESRLKPLEIIAAFDEMKQKFAPLDKSEITCENIAITGGNQLSMNCKAYSSDWDKQIISLDNGNISFVSGGGTSISRASSFIHFLSHYSESPFNVLENPSTFTAQKIQSGPYTQVTQFDLVLEYIKPENLSF